MTGKCDRWRKVGVKRILKVVCIFCVVATVAAFPCSATAECCDKASVLQDKSAVTASSFGWSADDATECLQKAIDSGADKIVVDRQLGDWIVRPVFVNGKSNLEIVFDDGVTVRAKQDEFRHINDCLFKFTYCTNIVFRGEGAATLMMGKKRYQDRSAYKWSEWRHILNIGRSMGVTISNLEARASGGDGVYVCNGARDVKLFDVRCYDNHRQGISIIACERFFAKNCVFDNTDGTAPKSGVDLEPGAPDENIIDAVFEDCVFNGNAGYGMQVVVYSQNSMGPPISCTFRRCKANGNGFAAIGVYGFASKWLAKGLGPIRGTILFEDCEGSGNIGGAMHFRDIAEKGFRVIVRNCRFDATGAKNAVDILCRQPFDFARLTCENVRIVTDREPKISFAPFYGAGAADCHGEITFVDAKNGRETVVDLEKWVSEQPRNPDLLSFKTEPIDYTRLAPATRGKLNEPVSTGDIDGSFTFVQCLPEAGEYDLEIEVGRRVPNVEPEKSYYRLVDKLGTYRGTYPLKTGKNRVVLKTDGPNVFCLQIVVRSGMALVRSRHPGCGVEAVAPLHTFGIHGRRYFVVPAAATEVRVKVQMQCDNIGALYDAAGRRVVERKPGEMSQNRVFLAKRTPTAEDELWAVGFDSNVWLNTYQIGSPALPIVFASPESAMVFRK